MNLRKIATAGLSMTLALSLAVTGSVYAGELNTEAAAQEAEGTETADTAEAETTQAAEETETAGSSEDGITDTTNAIEQTEAAETTQAAEETETAGSSEAETTESAGQTEATEITETTEATESTEQTGTTEATESTEQTGTTEATEITEATETTEETGQVEVVDELVLAKNSTVSVKDYGANGSDTKADTTAIQKALNAVHKAGGGTVTVPKGTYYIEQSLVIYSNTTLHLNDSAVIQRADSFSDKTYDETLGDYIYGPMLKNYSGTEDVLDGYGYDYSQEITIEGGTWNGGAGSAGETSDKPANIFQIYCATGVTVQNTTIKSVCGMHHIRLASVDDAEIKNVVFSDFVYYKWADYDGLETGDETDNAENEGPSITAEALQMDNYSAANVCKNIAVTECTFQNVLSGVGNHRNKVGGNISKIGASDIKIANNKFQTVANTCINLYDFATVDISGNTAESVRSFARVYKGEDCVISGNTVSALTSGNQYDLFRVSNGAKLTITGNTINGAGNTAVKLASKSTADITGNTFKGTISYNAVGVENSTANVVNNTLTEGSVGNYAVYFIGSKGTVNTNTISTAKLCSVYVGNTSSVTQINGNKITGGKNQGIYVLNASVSEINGNTVTSSGAEGIGVSGSSASVGNIVLNTVSKAGTEGIKVSGGAVVTNIGGSSTTGNTVTSSAGIGIYTTASSVTAISYNKVETAGSTSISIESAAVKASAANNTVSSGKGKGICASDSEVSISSNKISKTADTAIMVSGGKGTIKKNTIKTTLAGDGILVLGGAKISKLSKNKITKASKYAICIDGKKTKATVDSNTIDTVSKGNGIRVCNGKVTLTANTVKKSKAEGIYIVKGTVTMSSDNKISDAGSKKSITVKGGTVYVTSGNAKMQLKSGKLVVCGATSSSATKVTIPGKVKFGNVTYKVTEIAAKAFKNQKKLKTLTIGSQVGKIGKSALEGCSSLQTVTVNTSKLTEKNVGENAFKGIAKKCKFKVPSDKVTAYKKIFQGKGASQNITVTKK